ncbi:ubiquitin carboxyl-terminal hydrolase 12-like isoform X1 [Eucalyptus grandis]|uniref:ubiquitin carboxyl-terminal hydrolase 12-like isoform X1 n=2 Tax=Eucalyptus grandis TaxID=71139 RepID=UPI00192EFA33|nr:ubiquitin carboxyl-terminal hydrolase 12-like isoform X1 [Eucalyptus grandis]
MTSLETCNEANPVVTKEIRDVAPADYVLTIKSFSSFAKNNIEKHESDEFEVGGYKWKLIIYPQGDKSQEGKDHISVYLAVLGMSPPQHGGPIHVAVRFSLRDQFHNKYFTEQGRVMRVHALKAEWGIPRYMPLETFTDKSKGYLVDDACVFGVEVFIIKNSGVAECLTLKESTPCTHEWSICRLSSLGDTCLYSDAFTSGDYKWKVLLYPRGDSACRGENLSVFLSLVDSDKLASGQKVNVEYGIRLKRQCKEVQSKDATSWFSSSASEWGWPSFMPLKTVPKCQTDHSWVIETKVKVLGTTSKLP